MDFLQRVVGNFIVIEKKLEICKAWIYLQGGTSVVMCQSKSNGDKSVDIGYNDGLVFSLMNAVSSHYQIYLNIHPSSFNIGMNCTALF